MRKNCRELVPTSDISLPSSLMGLMACLLAELRDPKSAASAWAPKEVLRQLHGSFLFSLVWSVGATTEAEGRAKFSAFLRKLLDGAVDRKMERTDFDLGPGLEISDPGFKVRGWAVGCTG